MIGITLESTVRDQDLTNATRRVRNALARMHPTGQWFKSGSALESRMEPSGDLATAVREVREAAIRALGNDAAVVRVAARARRGSREGKGYPMGTVGTPEGIIESYHLG